MRRTRAALIQLVALTVVALGDPRLARAQKLDDGRPPRDVSLEILERPYTIRGSTAEGLALQMRSLGPGGRFISYPYFFRWSYTAEQSAGDFTGTPSGRCRVDELDVHFQVDATYPVWERDADAPATLVDAWEAFDQQLVSQWEERREGIFAYGREISQQVRRLQEACPFLQTRVREVVERLQDESSEAARDAAAAGERVILRWPPDGY